MDTAYAEIATDPSWHAHRYDPSRDEFQFRLTNRAEHRRATFLTDQYLGGSARQVAVGRSVAAAAPTADAPVHFIFHSAFCGSTLLARAVDIPGVAMGLKEPMLFNDLSGWAQRGGPAAGVAAALDASLTLLARPFAPGEAVVVKPSNIVTRFIPAILAMRPAASALFLEAPIRVFLGSVARKGMEGRLWARDLLVKLLRDGLVDFGMSGEDHLGQTDLQAAAVGWLAQHALFARMLAARPERTRSLDSETMLARPSATIAALADLFALRVDAEAVARGPAFRTHSKHGTGFDAAARRAEQAAGEAPFADEIEKVAVWIEAVAAAFAVPMALPRPLLGSAHNEKGRAEARPYPFVDRSSV